MFSRLSGEHAMDSGYYAAMTGLVARTQALDTAAGNLANAQTPGYRAEREYFRSTLLGSDAANSQLGRTVNNYGLLGGDRLSMAQGSLQTTGNPLDLAIEGEGFFQVQTANGLRYTRDGSFQRAQNGQLVTSAGEPVLSSAGKTIAVPPGEVSVGADGVLSVAGGAVATVGVLTFPAGTELTPEGANRCRSGSSKKCLRSPGRHREREPGRNSGFARSDRHAAAGGDDAEGADRLPYRIQQDRD
jgi:flagellar basal-body rod protein FlgF/flagellar basal-body rod protein FlgG